MTDRALTAERIEELRDAMLRSLPGLSQNLAEVDRAQETINILCDMALTAAPSGKKKAATAFSEFIRNASPEEKEKVYMDVMKTATERQNEALPSPGEPCKHEWFEGKCVHCHETPEGHIASLAAQLAQVREALIAARAVKVCCGEFDTCEAQCIPLVREWKSRAEAAEQALEEKDNDYLRAVGLYDSCKRELTAAEQAREAAERELTRMRKKFDQLLPGEHVWRSANETVKWPHCTICGIILRDDRKNSQCKGPATVKLRDAAIDASRGSAE